MTPQNAPRIVSAVGISSNSTLSGNAELADRVEAAMQQAIRECLDQGITAPDEQRERMLAAREAVLAE